MTRSHAVELAVALCRRFEGLHLRPYLCPAGVPTIGYGATMYEDGSRVTLADAPITRERAEALLRWQVERFFMRGVMRLVPTADTHGRLAALTDFAFNLGLGALGSSTLRRKALAGDWDAVEAELMKWVRAGGVVLRGLVLRRTAEVELIPA